MRVSDLKSKRREKNGGKEGASKAEADKKPAVKTKDLKDLGEAIAEKKLLLGELVERRNMGAFFADVFSKMLLSGVSAAALLPQDMRKVVFVVHVNPRRPDEIASVWYDVRFVMGINDLVIKFPHARFEIRQLRAGESLEDEELAALKQQNCRIVFMDTGNKKDENDADGVEVYNQHGQAGVGTMISSFQLRVEANTPEGQGIDPGIKPILKSVNRSDNIRRMAATDMHYYFGGLPFGACTKDEGGKTDWNKVFEYAFTFLDIIYPQGVGRANSMVWYKKIMREDPNSIFHRVRRKGLGVAFHLKKKTVKTYVLHNKAALRGAAFENPDPAKGKDFDADVVIWTSKEEAWDWKGEGPAPEGIWCGVQATRDWNVKVHLAFLAAEIRLAYAIAWGVKRKIAKKTLYSTDKIKVMVGKEFLATLPEAMRTKVAKEGLEMPVYLGDNGRFLLVGSGSFPLKAHEFPPFTAAQFETMALTAIRNS